MRPHRAALPLLLLIGTTAIATACWDDSTVPLAPEEASSAPEADALAQKKKLSEPIEGRYIVVFEDDVSDPPGLAKALSQANGIGVAREYRSAIKGFLTDIPEAGRDAVIAALERNPKVRRVEQDRLWFIDSDTKATVVNPSAPPNAPSDLSATPQSETEIALSWTDNSNDEHSFHVERCEGEGCSSFSLLDQLKRNTTSYADSELSAGIEYCYRVRAVGKTRGQEEPSPPSNVACATTDVPPPPPPAADPPTNLTATAQSEAAIGLTWTDNSDESGFEIERCEGSGCADFAPAGSVGPDVTAWTDADLSAATEYCYRVRGQLVPTPTDWSNVDCATTDAPPPPPPATDPPTDLAATPVSQSAIDLAWTDNSDETGFEIERCQGSGCSDFAVAGSVGADVTAWTDTGRSADTEYCYRVRGLMAPSPTGWSNTACATTLPASGGSEQFVFDSFEDAGGTILESHVGEAGATWTRHPNATGEARFRSSGSEVYSNLRATYWASGVAPGADYRVAARMHFHTVSDGSVRYAFVTGRTQETVSTMYMFGFVYAGTNKWELKKIVNGSESLLGQGEGDLPDPGDSPLVELRMEGSRIEGYVDGTLVVSATDTSIPGPGRAGLRLSGGDGTWASLMDLEATTLDLAPPPPPPPPPATDPPTNLSAAAQSSSAIGLTWSDNSDETSFEIERCEGSGCSDFAVAGSAGADVVTWADSDLTADTEYCYRVRGLLTPTPTGWSNVSCATTLPESGGSQRFVVDGYEDVGGTLLQSHNGEVGATWSRHADATGDGLFRSDGSEVYASARATYWASGTPPGADYRVASVMHFYTISDGAVRYSFVTGRMDESATTMYMFGFVYAGTNKWELKKIVNGSESLLGRGEGDPPEPGETPLVELRMEGTRIEGYVDGALLISVTDTSIPGPGRAGIRMSGGDGTWASLMDFEATTVDLAPPPPPPPPPVTDPPTNLIAVALVNGDIRLSWTDNSDETGFDVERCVGSGCMDFTVAGSVAADVTTYTDANLTAETEYCYRVRGLVDPVPTEYSDIACATSREYVPGDCPDTGNHDDLAVLWGIERIRANENPHWLGTQAGGDCAIQAHYYGLDSGVDRDHPDLNVVEAVSFVGDGSGGEDHHGHGSHTAGTAAAIDGGSFGVVGVAPGAPIFGFKVCEDGGSCPVSAILAGVDEVTARKLANPAQPMVANMSIGGDQSPTMDEAVRRSVHTGVVYAVAAGNGLIGACIIPWDAATTSPAGVGDDKISSDGGYIGDGELLNGVITTTSHDQQNHDVNCNYGTPVSVAAPGVNIISTYKDGQWAEINGTSMASPHAAGAALLYLQGDPTATPAEVEAAIVNLLESWTTDNEPNASGRLDVGDL